MLQKDRFWQTIFRQHWETSLHFENSLGCCSQNSIMKSQMWQFCSCRDIIYYLLFSVIIHLYKHILNTINPPRYGYNTTIWYVQFSFICYDMFNSFTISNTFTQYQFYYYMVLEINPIFLLPPSTGNNITKVAWGEAKCNCKI